MNHLFKKKEQVRSKVEPEPKPAPTEFLVTASPSWWMVVFYYFLAILFLWASDLFFKWFTPYFEEVFKNLKGLPITWADLGIFWAERGLGILAVLMAVYHNLWKMTTRYRLSSHNLQVETWLPMRKVTIISFGAIQKTGFTQGILGVLLNFAHIEIDTGSSLGPMILPNCAKYKILLNALEAKVESVHQPHLSTTK